MPLSWVAKDLIIHPLVVSEVGEGAVGQVELHTFSDLLGCVVSLDQTEQGQEVRFKLATSIIESRVEGSGIKSCQRDEFIVVLTIETSLVQVHVGDGYGGLEFVGEREVTR